MGQLTHAQRYLTTPNKSFWRWSKDGKGIEWSDGTTIAFREEVVTVLERLQPEGLAPLDMIVLLLATCRSSWIPPDKTRLNMLTTAMGSHSTMRKVHWTETLISLERISSLPDQLKTSITSKTELVAVVLGRHPLRISSELSKEVVRELKHGFPYDTDNSEEIIKSTGEWIRGLQGLCDGTQRIDADALRLRLATGLDQPLEITEEVEIPEEISRPVNLREFLKQLEDDEELGGMARLTRQLMAVVHLPKHIQDEEDMPLGGVSDISNRGPLDRLLISELANDDDTLMTRVALREALYLRRETTMSNPPQRRRILLDSGLRMWGVPRIFATSVALSLAATTDQTTELFRAAGGEIDPIDFLSRDGLTEHLGKLELEVHPGESLPAFNRDLDSDLDEVIYVIGEDVFADEAFRKQLRENRPPLYYVATVNRQGRFRLLSYSERGERLVREATLDLSLLFPVSQPRKLNQSLIDEKIDPKLPAILRLKKFPLRLSHNVDRKSIIDIRLNQTQYQPGLLTITRDRRFMLWDKTNRGARQLAKDIPSGDILCVKRDNEIVRIVIGRNNGQQCTLVWLDTETFVCKVYPLECPNKELTCAAIHAGMVMLIYSLEVHVFHGTDGTLKTVDSVRSDRWISGHFFMKRNELFALSFDGLSIRKDALTVLSNHRNLQIVFDSEVCDSPVIVHENGSIQIPPASPIHIKHQLHPPVVVSEVAPDGAKIVLSSHQDRTEHAIVSLPDLSMNRCRGVIGEVLKRRAMFAMQQRSLRVKIQSIAVAADHIILRNSRGVPLLLKLSPDKSQLTLLNGKALTPQLSKNFDRHQIQTGDKFRFREAEWNDGSRAILDSRGLLHIQSGDASIPEVTLVLYDQHISGWCSDGTVFGDDYFLIEGMEKVSAEEIMENVLKPFVRGLR